MSLALSRSLLCTLFLLGACSGGGSTSGNDGGADPDGSAGSSSVLDGALVDGAAGSGADVDGGPNRAPIAAFTAAQSSVVAGEPLAFDASASSDADGDALRYSWSFGDGGRGGSARLAHVFPSAGSYDVRLTVADGRGGMHSVVETVTVSAAPAATQQVTVTVRVLDANRAPLQDATLTVVGSAATAITDADGAASLQLGAGIKQVLHVQRAGYLRQIRATQLPEDATQSYLEIALQLAPALLTLDDAAAGGMLLGSQGARVTLPANALVDGNGDVVSGPVQVQIAPVDVVRDPAAFPGSWGGIGPDGARGALVSFGTVDFVFTQAGKKLDLAPGQVATVELPVFPRRDVDGSALSAGKVLPLWALDEQSGEWIQEGEAALVASSESPTGLVQRAQVSHFSWWNCDDFTDVHELELDCCVDENDDDVCDGPAACFVGGRSCTNPTCTDLGEEPFPQYGASTSIPSGDKQTLVMPDDLTIAIDAYGEGGLTKGRYISAAGTTASASAQIVLKPFLEPPSDQLITLPFELTTAAAAAGTPTVYEFDASAGQNIWIAAERAQSSQLTGVLRLRSPSDAALQSLSFDSSSASFVHEITTTGRYRVEVVSNAPVPSGAYRIRVRVVGSEMTVVAMSPAAGSSDQSPSTISVTFARPVKAGSVTTSSFKVFGPAGEVVRATTGGIVVNAETVTFTPRDPLGAGFPYRVQLTTAIQDTTNVPLIEAYQGAFTTLDAVGVYARVALVEFGNFRAAMASDGSVMLVFRRNGAIHYTRYVPDVGWSMPEALPGQVAGSATNPRVAVTDGGHAMVVWLDTSESNTLYSASYSPTLGWSAPTVVPIDATARIGSLYTEVALDAQGRAIVIFQAESSSAGWYNRYVPDSGWAAPAQFATAYENGRVVLNADGQGALAYRSTYDLMYAPLDPDEGTFATPVSLGNNQSGSLGLGIDSAGNVFSMRVTGGGEVHLARHPANGDPLQTRQVPGASASNCGPSLAVSSGGGAAVIFCKTGPNPYVDRWPGQEWAVWDASVQLNDAGGLTYTRIAPAGTGYVAAYEMPSDAVDPSTRAYAAGTWDATDTLIPGLPGIANTDHLLGSAAGRVIYVYDNGSVVRLK